jgi:hypothetical protein
MLKVKINWRDELKYLIQLIPVREERDNLPC